jgi:ribonuclease HI
MSDKQQDTWLAWFDGSALPNPGRIGIGALLRGPQGQVVEVSRRAGDGSSSEAEYLALIALLEAALPHQPVQLIVHGDSQVVIDDLKPPRRGKSNAKGLEALRARALHLIAQLGGAEVVTVRWVPRHRNPDADRLSQAAVRPAAAAVQPSSSAPDA